VLDLFAEKLSESGGRSNERNAAMQISDTLQTGDTNALAVSEVLAGQTVEQVIAVVDDIVGAAQAGSPAAFEELLRPIPDASIRPFFPSLEIRTMQRKPYGTRFFEPTWRLRDLKANPQSTHG
jgi:hypothetical protein